MTDEELIEFEKAMPKATVVTKEGWKLVLEGIKNPPKASESLKKLLREIEKEKEIFISHGTQTHPLDQCKICQVCINAEKEFEQAFANGELPL